jgi:hypothetical protein
MLLFDIYPKLTDISKALLVNAFFISTNSIYCIKNRDMSAVLGNFHALTWSFKNFRYIWQNKLNHWSKIKISHEKLKEDFVRVKLPFHFCIMPSKAGADYFALKVAKYENSVMKEK